jgi:thymidine phosphorylase
MTVIEWDSLTECAVSHGVKQATIKSLIHYGGTLDGLSTITTFDIPADCPLDTRETKGKKIVIYDTRTGMILDGGASKRTTAGVAC